MTNAVFNNSDKMSTATSRGALYYFGLACSSKGRTSNGEIAYEQMHKAFIWFLNNHKYEHAVTLAFHIDQLLFQSGQYRRILENHRQIGPYLSGPIQQVASLWQRAKAHTFLGEVNSARNCYLEVRGWIPNFKDPIAEAAEIGNLGNCFAALGEAEEAIRHYKEALALAQKCGNRNQEAKWKCNLAIQYKVKGMLGEAATCYKEVLDIVNTTPHEQLAPELLPQCLAGQGECYSLRGHTREAIGRYQEALELVRAQHDPLLESLYLCNLGTCFGRLGEGLQAHKLLDQAGVLARTHHLDDIMGNVLHSWAEIFIDEKRYSEAITYASEGARLGESIPNYQIIASNHLVLATAYLYSGSPAKARASARIAEDHRVAHIEHQASVVLAIAALQEGDDTTAKAVLARGLERASILLKAAPDNYQALYTYALCLSGEMICGSRPVSNEAILAYQRAVEANQDEALLRRMANLYNALAQAVSTDQWRKTILSENRPSAFAAEANVEC
ncbi:MAG TPA: tetratricopeptide repeat protein [Chloroflexia bacterium]|jgi:tetratricopeptide (TPR) repeat protein